MTQKIFVAGDRGMVGAAVVRRLGANASVELVTRTREQLHLCDQAAVREFFFDEQPDAVVFCAARVGGIHANHTYPAEFAYENLAMALNAVHAAFKSNVARFLFLGSTCIYPRDAPQPLEEAALLTGPLEATNEAYALAKIAGIKLCQYYRRQYGVLFHSAMPTNLYGPGDNYHPENSHVLPGLLRRFHEAKVDGRREVSIWGTGTPRREFLYVDDLAGAICHLLTLEDPPDWVNVGTGVDISISELAQLVAETVEYEGDIIYDHSKPDGTPVKRTNIDLIRQFGWSPTVTLRDGLRRTYQHYLAELSGGVVRIR